MMINKVTPKMFIEDIFAIDNLIVEGEGRKEYYDYSAFRYTFYKPVLDIGVYVLYHEDRIVYIGYSKQLYKRVRSHCTSKKILWDRFEKYVIGCELMSRFIEENLIVYYKPMYNQISKSGNFIHEM